MLPGRRDRVPLGAAPQTRALVQISCYTDRDSSCAPIPGEPPPPSPSQSSFTNLNNRRHRRSKNAGRWGDGNVLILFSGTFSCNQRRRGGYCDLDAQRWARGLKTPVNKLRCASWIPHGRLCASGLFLPYNGHQPKVGHKVNAGYSPAVDLAPAIGRIWGPAQRAGMVRRAMSHMNAAIYRAMAVFTTVDFFPRWLSLRYRVVRRD